MRVDSRHRDSPRAGGHRAALREEAADGEKKELALGRSDGGGVGRELEPGGGTASVRAKQMPPGHLPCAGH